MKVDRWLPRALLVAAALGSGAGAYWSARLACAELLYARDTSQSVERAARLAPGNAQYLRRSAELAEAAGPDPAKAQQAWETVLRARPGDSDALIALGLRAEMSNRLVEAQRDLLEAARHDRGYDPRWSLANYYLRRQDDPAFWRWARAACQMAYDPAPLFHLLWNYTGDPAQILDRAIPDRPGILRQYLTFLIGESHWEAAAAVAARILQRPGTEDTPVLMAYCNRLLALRRGRDAMEVWNALARRKLTGFSQVGPDRGLVNGAFRTPPGGRGFDWRIPPAEGIQATQDPPGLQLSFSGYQPEACEPLWQYAVLKPGVHYNMTFDYATSGVAEASGLRWRVLDITREPVLIAESENLAHEGWERGSVSFTTPAGMSLGRVVLGYRRAPGTARIEGFIRLRNAALEGAH